MWIDVENERVFAQTGGQSFNSGKQSVVLIHGAGMDQTVWQQQSRYLAHHGWNVFAIDMPGHGASEGSAPDSVRAGAEWVVSLLDALDLPRVSLVGHSLGALMSLEAAGRFAERVDKLALLGISAEMPVHQDLLDAAKANEPIAGELIVGWGFGKQAHCGGNIAPGMWMMGGGNRLLQNARPGVLGADLAAANAYEHGIDAAKTVQCPTLLLLGAADRMTPAKSAAVLQETIADCRTEILSGAGHMMMVEAPRETLRALVAFLGKGQ